MVQIGTARDDHLAQLQRPAQHNLGLVLARVASSDRLKVEHHSMAQHSMVHSTMTDVRGESDSKGDSTLCTAAVNSSHSLSNEPDLCIHLAPSCNTALMKSPRQPPHL